MKLPGRAWIREVGPRDGLQNEPEPLGTEDKIAWIDRLSSTGLGYIETTSFVSPRWIPALADAMEVARGLRRRPGVVYAALVPNARGLERALEAGIDEVSVFLSASETHNRSNINKSIAETLPVVAEVSEAARSAGRTVRGYVSTAFGCPYEGKVKLDDVVRVTDFLLENGASEVSLGDTIGVAIPRQVEEALEKLLARYPADRLALHFHDTRGMALANIAGALRMGIARFDASTGGLGGCPYAPGASGNVATEDVVHMLSEMGIETGVSLPELIDAAGFVQSKLGKRLPSRGLQARGRRP
ncbi:hydroxymethylglutaryl-CoA lyase [Cohnella xylanilytica]|uniref:Hydroxymethylglutaryl-CoA lyase n=1 Tax=Cohnella xylanilytica TaxID=557555 RepID=A0A841U605_9BACL|nr:hydroxymethylglutaryl-CoA lyase [Cohnella xylanilytica]MBB6693481.1 hydroxymethylglutaryl-CoA lyase [Cohnella xylanilytica]